MRKRNLVVGLVALLVVIAGIWGGLDLRAHISPLTIFGRSTVLAGPTNQTSLYRTGTRAIPTVKVSTSTVNCDPKDIPRNASEPDDNIVAAIKPHLCSIPTFTEQDVLQYMSTVSSFNSRQISQISAKYIITRILFVTNQVANAANGLNADTGISDPNRIICYVEVYGDFRFDGGPPRLPTKATPTPRPILHHGELMFDGISGKPLGIGVDA
jgi:hypothetical protein